MREDTVDRIEIDGDGRLLVFPSSETFPHVWREAMEVHWDEGRSALYAPPPRRWSRGQWLRQILDAARAQGCGLRVSADTTWVGVETDLKDELLRAIGTG